MLLNDIQITKFCRVGMVEPFLEVNVNPASLNLSLGNVFIELVSGGVVDNSNPDKLTTQRKITLQGKQKYLLQPGTFVLAASSEHISLPLDVAAEVKLRSTTARKGIGHVYSGWIDPGFEGNITFELFSHVPVFLVPGEAICQIVFFRLDSPPSKGYAGKYQHQQGPTPARYEQTSFADEGAFIADDLKMTREEWLEAKVSFLKDHYGKGESGEVKLREADEKVNPQPVREEEDDTQLDW